MIFNKAQKRFLKDSGLWKKVKKYARADSEYMSSPEACGSIPLAFTWADTKEGHAFWDNVLSNYEKGIPDVHR